ncbi:hypothetical protein LHYA1_G006388 [Lachnellula hyalina]|uniref:Arrestin-like N-terminal domain-containing protein n=1 Tax=Lachnellula hyalina TaxID=1316788 RepID=A0A8H8QXG8_9HELO|nr:uncharacterized protein LHYA1_G006388 [Lachnellula hyalina]TVY24628.1 hypothetical protein LHYA1_G006388 [Lachnellula hyalina]
MTSYRRASYAASIQSTTGSIASYAKRLAQQGRPDMEIILDDHIEGKIYTTFDALSGKVEITAPYNARFDEIHITLEGTVKTFVDDLSPEKTKSKTTALHKFLKLVMPISENDYPQPRVAEAGRTYTFPFNFVIPDQLLPRSCSHTSTAEHVRDAHLQLPPSMGDRELSVKDDMAPEMSKVQYAIKVRVVRNQEANNKDIVLVEGLRKLHIVPAVTEAPPMSIEPTDDEFTLSKTKSLKKGMFSGKLGKITVSAAQTSALILPAPSSDSCTPPTTMATMNLRFDPHESSSQPPRLGGLTTKIKVWTYFAVRPSAEFPTYRSSSAIYETYRGVYGISIPLSSRCVESVVWTRHTPSPAYARRDSASSTESSDCSDNVYAPAPKESAAYYSATIVVPITLPSSKTWVPSFHNCITSRVYTIDLNLTIHTPGAGVPASSVALRIPVQIAAAGNHSRRATLTVEEAAAELAGADEYLVPRLIEMPHEDLIGNSVLAQADTSELPPSYEDFALPQQIVGRC